MKYQIRCTNNSTGKQFLFGPLYDSVEEAIEGITFYKGLNPNKTVIHNDEVYYTWDKINIFGVDENNKVDFSTTYHEDLEA
ncbi:MAG: hypothetical protein ACO390_17695 [bacterium]